ncbi:MAG: hypothetical protein ACEQSR_01325 [Candidatus Methylacidiphilales bacterium]
MTCKIDFPEGEKFKTICKPHSIHIDSNYKNMIATAEIVVARNISFFDNYNPRSAFKHGSPVTIAIGYNGNLTERFSGYIVEVSADYPITIKLMDEMSKLKKVPVNFSSTSTTLSQLLNTICNGYKVDALEGVSLGAIRLSKTNVGAVLEKLRSDFGLYSYMDGKTLVCGKYYADNSDDAIGTINLDNNTAENSLVYRTPEDIIALVKGTATIKNQKIEYQVGTEGGDVYNFDYKQATSLDTLKLLVNKDYEKLKRGGFSGSVSSFGDPVYTHGEKVNLVSNVYPDRTGTYYIDSVIIDYAPSGFAQKLTIGGKA